MFQILVAVGPDEKHGYAVMQELDEVGGSSIGPGTLYRSIKQLLEAGLLEETQREVESDPRRRYYRVTEAGAAAASVEAERLAKLVSHAEKGGLFRRGGSPAPSPGTG
jgi:DNA-binding PadR family transcriptional regulator